MATGDVGKGGAINFLPDVGIDNPFSFASLEGECPKT